mmetsp:Transcript_2227/g.8200  ORF Transcript_2227/g.8200 Transcript_2227/m.8200 type:complete len:1406 (-) Transcript_2227:1761-5978(-)|eukprot:CAMPEP_0117441676 /NCGR_PEP_ID=MMETSP0759-20121206/3756_1 /TAXON_ID=63605 /ORGANISM="Percolomonas cosmopolitus, Strain WS" /LENGTH=1405 /DNA_ID=CAMNT_0005233535 /DNA_START=293 /DNA_END=4510 /DNA_ORIENTATION=-
MAHFLLLTVLSAVAILIFVSTVVFGDTLSLYHYSGTTFLELPLDSPKFRLTHNFQSYVDFDTLRESLEEILVEAAERAGVQWDIAQSRSESHTENPIVSHPQDNSHECTKSLFSVLYSSKCCVTRLKDANPSSSLSKRIPAQNRLFVYKNAPLPKAKPSDHTVFTDLELSSSGTLRFKSFLTGPAGDNERKGWIVNETQYLPTEKLNAASHSVASLISHLEGTSLFRTTNFDVDVLAPQDFSPQNAAQAIYNLVRVENREHQYDEPSFRKAPHSFSSGFIKALSRSRVESNSDFQWSTLYDLCLRELTHDLVSHFSAHSIQPYNHTHNEFIANHTFTKPGHLSPLLPNLNPSTVWTLDTEQIEAILLSHPFVIREKPINIYPLIFSHFSQEPVVRKFSSQFQIAPFMRMSEFASDPLTAIQRAVGYIKSVQYFTYYIADQAIVQMCNLELKVIKKLRQFLLEETEPIIFKYTTMDPEKCPNFHNDDIKEIRRAYQKDNVIYGFIATNVHGIAPLIIPHESIVYHQRTEHRFNVLGRFNPALEQFNVAHLLENKYIEHKFWESICPGIMPKAIYLPDVLPKDLDLSKGVPPEVFTATLDRVFPQGWIAKAIWDYNSVGKLITHQLNYTNLVESYRSSNFDSVVLKKLDHLAGCEPIEDFNDLTKHHMHYMGWKIDSMLRNPYDVMVQEWLRVEEEQRVECNIGHCPYELMLEGMGTAKEAKYIQDYYQTAINTKFMECIKKMPDKLRGLPLTSDAALTVDQTVHYLETNPGGNSWLLSNDVVILKKHNRFLKEFPHMIRNKKAYYQGMTPRQQMKYIQRMMKQWGLTLQMHSNRFKFLPDRITDEEHVLPYPMDMSRVDSNEDPPVPPKRVHPEARQYLMNDALRYIELVNPNSSPETMSQYMDALTNFMFYKETNPDFYIQVVHVVEKARAVYSHEFRAPLNNKISTFEQSINMTSLTKDKPLSEAIFSPLQQQQLGRFIMSCVRDVFRLQLLDFPHEDLRYKLNTYFSLFNALQIPKDQLNHLLFEKFNLWNYQLFDSVVTMTQSRALLGDAVKGSFQLLDKIVAELSHVLSTFHAMDRVGFSIVNLDTREFVKIWTPKIRSLYDLDIVDWNAPKNADESEIAFVGSLTQAVASILMHFSDNSLFRLDPLTFEPEFRFLKKALPFIMDTSQDVVTVGQSLDFLLLIGEESDILELVFRAQTLLQQSQNSDDGGFGRHTNEASSIAATHAAVKGLVDHDYSQSSCCTEFGETVKFDTFKDELSSFGLMMNWKSSFAANHFTESQPQVDFVVSFEGKLESNPVFEHHYLKMRLEKYTERAVEKRRNALLAEKEKEEIEKLEELQEEEARLMLAREAPTFVASQEFEDDEDEEEDPHDDDVAHLEYGNEGEKLSDQDFAKLVYTVSS